MKNEILIIMFSIILALGCENKEEGSVKYYNDFPVLEEVKTVPINISDSVLLNFPSKMTKSDSLFAILDYTGGKSGYCVYLFKYPSFEYVNSIFKLGQGPNEVTSLNNIEIIDDTLYAYGVGNRIYYSNILKSTGLIDKITLSQEFGFLLRGTKTTDRYYFPAFKQNNKGRILEFNDKGEFISGFGQIISNNSNKQMNNDACMEAYMPFIHSNGNILAAVTQFGEVIEIYNLVDKNQFTLIGKGGRPKYQNVNGHAKIQGIIGFESVFVSNNNIYALYNGIDFEKYQQPDNEMGGQLIYVFDLNGNPVKKFILDKKFISIYVDEITKKIFLINTNSDQQLYYFNL